MSKPVRKLLLLSLILAISVVNVTSVATSTSEVSDLDILIVNDGHSLNYDGTTESWEKDDHPLDRQMFSRYTESLKEMEGINITSYNTTATGKGPESAEMAGYDMVIWYLLADSDTTEPNTLTSSDIGNISRYLNREKGRILLTGQNIGGFPNLQEETGAYMSQDKKNHLQNGDSLVTRKLSEKLRGEADDEITGNSLEYYTINFTVAGRSNRDYLMDLCSFEKSGEGPVSGFSRVCELSDVDDSLKAYYTTDGSKKNYLLNYSITPKNEDFVNGLVHSSRPRYKTVYMELGFESIEGKEERDYLMRNIVNFLAGPRMKDTRIEDSKGGLEDSENRNYNHHTNSTINISTTCENQQIAGNSEFENITDARFFYTLDGELGPSIDQGFETETDLSEYNAVNAINWTIKGDTSEYDYPEINSYCGRNEGKRSLHLQGGEWDNGYSVETPSVNLSKKENVTITYSIFMPGGNSKGCYKPETGAEDDDVSEDKLNISYNNSEGVWKTLITYNASDLQAGKWKKVDIELPKDSLHQDFRLRFDPKSDYDTDTYGIHTDYYDDGDTWAIDDVVLDDGVHMVPLDGEFNSSNEKVEINNFNATNVSVDLSNESLYYRGANFTYGVQCRGSTKNPHWSKFNTQWMNVDVLKPSSPYFIEFKRKYSRETKTTAELIYAYINEEGSEIRRPPEQRADVIRFKCNDNTWSEWKKLDKSLKDGSKDTQEIEVNISQKKCGIGDGNRSIEAQVSDFAGNIRQETVSDWIVLDTKSPNITASHPLNDTYINESQKFRINSTDYKGIADVISGIDPSQNQIYNNGTENGTFKINSTFEPDFEQENQQSLTTYILDRVSNVLKTVFRFKVDLTPPTNTEPDPGNSTVLTRSETFSVGFQDSVSNVSSVSFSNGTSWFRNETPRSEDYQVSNLDPGWTDEGRNELKIVYNDSVGHRVVKNYVYHVDESPPKFFDITPDNRTVINPTKNKLRIDIADRFRAGLDTNLSSFDGKDNITFNANQSFNPGWNNEELDGWHNITAWVNDTLGFSNSIFLEFKLDSNKPVIEEVIPRTGSYLNSSGKINIYLTDPTSNISFIRVYNGTDWFQKKVGDSSSAWFNITSLWKNEGTRYLTVFGNDSAGNSREKEYEPFYLDKTPPEFTVEKENRSYVDFDTEITVSANDPKIGQASGSGISEKIFNNGTGNYTFTDSIRPNWTESVEQRLRIWVNDNVSNTNFKARHYLVDNLPPVVTGSKYANESIIPSYPSLDFTVEDLGPEGGSGIDQITLNNGTVNETFSSSEIRGYEPGWESGEKNLTIWKEDSLGNINSTKYTYFVDSQPPETTTNYTWSGWRNSNISISVNTTDNYDPGRISTCVTTSTCEPVDTGNPNVTVNIGCSNNDTCQKYLSYRSNDSVGNLEPTQTTDNISIDKESPVIEFQNPEEGKNFGGIIEFRTDIQDISRNKDLEGVGLKSANYSIINTTSGNSNIVQSGSLNQTGVWDYNVSWNSTKDTLANYTFNVSAVDELGNSLERNISFKVDNGAPTITISAEDSRTYFSEDFSATITAKRAGSTKLQNHTYSIVNQSDNSVVRRQEVTGLDVNEHTFNPTIDISNLEDGNYTINSTAWDQFSPQPNRGTNSRIFKVDTKPPEFSILSPENESWQKGSTDVNYIIDEDRKLERCYTRYNDGSGWSKNSTLDDCSAESYSFQTGNCPDSSSASCVIELFGEDLAGNIESTRRHLRIDNSAPSLTITSPPSGKWFNSDFELIFDAEDPQGIKKQEYRYTGSGWTETGSESFTVDISGCSEGSRTCRAEVNITNNANTSTVKLRNFSIDVTDPVVDGVDFENRSNITSDTEIGFEFSDELSRINSTSTVFFNGSENVSFSSGSSFIPGWEEGKVEPVLWLIDNAGNVLRKRYRYTVDDTAPVIDSITPRNDTNITPSEEFLINGYDVFTAVKDLFYRTGSSTVYKTINETFTRDWDSETVGYRWLNVSVTDYVLPEPNKLVKKYRYFVDGVPPSVRLDFPENDTVIDIRSSFRINASDSGVGVKGIGYFTNSSNLRENFTLNQTYDPDWDSDASVTQGDYWLEANVEDSLGNRETKGYLFTLDGTPPEIQSLSFNRSFVKPGEKILLSSRIVEEYSKIDKTKFRLESESGNTLTTYTPKRDKNLFTKVYIAPEIETQNITLNVTTNDTIGYRDSRNISDLRLDSKAPVNVKTRIDRKIDEGFGERRIYRNKDFLFNATVQEDTEVETVKATVKKPDGSETNHTLELVGGDRKNGSWEFTFNETDTVGTYNLTYLYSEDLVGNINRTLLTDRYVRVVNHSLNISLEGDRYIDADHREPADINISFNQTIEDPDILIYTPETGEGTEFSNVSAISCIFEGSCEVSRHDFEEGIIRIEGEGEGSFITLETELQAPSPYVNTNYTWNSEIREINQSDLIEVEAPLLNITDTFCSNITDCQEQQNNEFRMDIQVENVRDTNHTGDLKNITSSYRFDSSLVTSTDSIEKEVLESGKSQNFTFYPNLSEAGILEIKSEIYDKTGRYYDESTEDLKIIDTEKPAVDSTEIDNSLTNVNTPILFETQARDNKNIKIDDGIADIRATFINTTGNSTNVSLDLDQSSATESEIVNIWSTDYELTDDKGEYSISRIFVTDHEGNMLSEEVGIDFRVINLALNASNSPRESEVGEDVLFQANVSGNVVDIESVKANITKPRNVFEQVELEESQTENDFEAYYTNVSRSGNYSANITVLAGNSVQEQTEGFRAEKGTPEITIGSGNSTHVLLPEDVPFFNLSWRIDAVNGDLINSSARIYSNNTSVVTTVPPTEKTMGNITYEEGYQLVSFNVSPENLGTSELTLSFNHSGTAKPVNKTITGLVNSTDKRDPFVEKFTESPDTVNRNDEVVIETDISDLSVIRNVTAQIIHPDTGTGYVESREKMEKISRKTFLYRFTNTTETGHYTYNITAKDYSDNTVLNRSYSFNVTEDYSVNINPEHSIYKKGEEGIFEVEVTDINGEPVKEFRTSMVLSNGERNITLIDAETSSTGSYSFSSDDLPVETTDIEKIPYNYDIFANVSKEGNTGRTKDSIGVTRILNFEFLTPEQNDYITPGKEFTLRIRITGPRGNPINYGTFFATCNNCEAKNTPKRLRQVNYDGVHEVNFTATDEQGAALSVFGTDSYGNSEGQEGQTDPFISVNFGTETNQTEGTTGETGGGGGGGGGLPAQIDIERLSPGLDLESSVEEANLSVRTSMSAECRYGEGLTKSTFSTGYPMITSNGILHYAMVDLPEPRTYSYNVICSSGEQMSEEEIVFSLGEKEISTYSLRLPSEIGPVEQGKQGNKPFSIYNNGTAPITLEVETESECCETWVGRNSERLENITVEDGEEISQRMYAEVPLYIEQGEHEITITFTGERTRERTLPLIVSKSPLTVRLEEIRSQMQNLEKTIERFNRTGVDTRNLVKRFEELENSMRNAEKARKNDHQSVMENQLSRATTLKEDIEAEISAKRLEATVRENWWKWLLEFIGAYTVFFLITMVFIPYYRTRSELINSKEQLESAVEARKKAEKQYFKRQIDRDTFMKIMTERQDEVLELRGEIEELEKEMETVISDRLTFKNYIKAPVKAFREIAGLIHTFSSSEEEQE